MTEISATGRPISKTGGYDEVRKTGRDQSFWLDGQLHRTDGPALVTAEGDEHWYVEGRRHRADGPAIVTRNGAELFFVDGQAVPSD